MTHDQYIQRAANALPHRDPDAVAVTVEDIMRERGVGKRYAYSILRQMATEQYAEAEVPTNQRERVLAILYRSDGSIPNSRDLMLALQEEGYAIDGHDTTKVLWSLQKTNHVKFREHQNPKYLYAIRLTAQGKADGRKYATKPKHEPVEEALEAIPFDELPEGMSIYAEPTTVELSVPVQAETVPVQRAKPWTLDMEGFPAFREIRDRARKAQKLTEAAKLLEEAGEDEMALNLIGKTEFTPLEEEVIEILKRYEEIG